MANSDTTTLNRVKYAGLDFDTHEDDLRARMQVKFAADYNDFSTSSLGIMLLDTVAFGLDTLSFYLDRRATDTYLATARTRKAVSRLCRQLGYKMRGAVSSCVDLSVSVKLAKTFNVTIPQYFQFSGPNGLIFSAANPVTYIPSEQGVAYPKIVPCFEGQRVSESFTSDGAANQVFLLKKVESGKFLAAGSVVTMVDGGNWVESDFIEFEATDQFEVGFNDEPPTVRFGDGVAGNIPKRGSSIVVSYVITSGKVSQVMNGTITKEVVPLIISGQSIPLVLTNPLGSGGGDDAEDLEHAKWLLPEQIMSHFLDLSQTPCLVESQ